MLQQGNGTEDQTNASIALSKKNLAGWLSRISGKIEEHRHSSEKKGILCLLFNIIPQGYFKMTFGGGGEGQIDPRKFQTAVTFEPDRKIKFLLLFLTFICLWAPRSAVLYWPPFVLHGLELEAKPCWLCESTLITFFGFNGDRVRVADP